MYWYVVFNFFEINEFENNVNKTKVICANSKFELRNVTVGEVAWLRGEEKDGTEECYHGDGRTNEQVNIYILFFNVFCTILYLYLC